MNKIKLYRKILITQLGILATLVLHYFTTAQRGYKAIGGEFLTIPLLYVLYKAGQLIKARAIETKEHFKAKEVKTEWQQEGFRDYAK